jgi:hypothetical protein
MSLCRKKNKTFDIAIGFAMPQAIAFLQDAVRTVVL